MLKGGSFNNTEDLTSGETEDYSNLLSGSLATPVDTPAGNYYICAWVDSGQNVTEADETNNYHCEPISIEASAAVSSSDEALPDLSVVLTTPPSAQPGEVIGANMVVKVWNLGNAAAHGKLAPGTPDIGYGVDIYIATTTDPPPSLPMFNTSFSENVLLLGGRANNTTVVPISDSVDYSTQLSPSRIPADTPSGDYYICAWVDPEQNVIEENENNNTNCVPITIGTIAQTGSFGIKLASECAILSKYHQTNTTASVWDTPVVISVERSGGHAAPVTFELNVGTQDITGSFAPATISGSGSDTTVLTLTAGPSLSGSFETESVWLNPITVEASDGEITESRTITILRIASEGDFDGDGDSESPMEGAFAASTQFTDFARTTIAAGGSDQYGHTLAVTRESQWSEVSDGQVMSWGSNGFGELGNNDIGNDRSEPVTVLGPDGMTPLQGIVAVAAGRTHSLALREDGTLWAWGYAAHGQLGGNQGMGAGFTGTDPVGSPIHYVPFAVPVCGLPNFVAVAAGDAHSLALDTNSMVFAWGHNQWGALGDGTSDNRWMPSPVLHPSGGVLFGISVIGAGHFHSMAANASGDLYAWGKNEYGALGDMNQPIDASLPTAVLDESGQQITNIVDVDGGYQHSIALDSSGTVFVWGDNYWGQLGNDTMDKTLSHDQQTQDFATALTGTTVGVLPNQDIDAFPAVDVDAGADHSLVVTGSDQSPGCNSVFSFGWGTLGQNGNGQASERDYVPVESTQSLIGHRITSVSAMGSHSVLLSAWEPYGGCGPATPPGIAPGVGSVYTWGDNRLGQLGIGEGSGLPPCTLGLQNVACETTTNLVLALSNAVALPLWK